MVKRGIRVPTVVVRDEALLLFCRATDIVGKKICTPDQLNHLLRCVESMSWDDLIKAHEDAMKELEGEEE